MSLPLPTVPYTKTFAQIVSDFSAAAQAQSATPLDFETGSVFLALAEATAGNADWLQKLFLFALIVERLATSQGSWVDTFTADFMPVVAGTQSPRLPAAPASGQVTFSSNAFQSQRIIPVGALVATFDGSQVYKINADTTNSAYNATIIPGGGFVIPVGQQTLNVTATALTAGTAANVNANTITLIRSPIVGVDTVTNPAPLTTGMDQESDAALKVRFALFIASLSKATEGAIGFAITSIQQGLQYAIHESVDPNGATDYGSVVVYVDDGSGFPSATLVQEASTAVSAVRAAGTRPQVLGATALDVNITMTIKVAVGYNVQTVTGSVSNAVGSFVNNTGLEKTLVWSELIHVAYNASPGVVNVTNTLLNGQQTDVIPGMGQTIKLGTITISSS